MNNEKLINQCTKFIEHDLNYMIKWFEQTKDYRYLKAINNIKYSVILNETEKYTIKCNITKN